MSDIDLLVVVPDLPAEWDGVFALENELERMGLEQGIRLDICLVEPQAVSYAVTWATPLLLEVYDAHRILYDPSGVLCRGNETPLRGDAGAGNL